MKATIIETLKTARGNKEALLSLASAETCDQVAAHFNVAPVIVAPKVAQRVFGAQEITIEGTQQTFRGRFKKRYDLTNCSQAYAALRWWGCASASLNVWHECGKDIDAYYAAFEQNDSLYRHCVQSLKLTRHNS